MTPARGVVRQIWVAPSAAAPMQQVAAARAIAGRGLAGDRYALGGGTWARYPDLEKQVTLIDGSDVAAIARETGARLTAGDTRRNLVTEGVELPALVGRWFTVGEALLFGMKRCPPCAHLERLTGVRLIKAMALRGGINAAVFADGVVAQASVVQVLTDREAAARGAPTGTDRPVPRSLPR